MGGLNTGHMIRAHLIGQLIVNQKIAVDFWTKRKCHLRVTGDSTEGHLPDSDTIGWVAIPPSDHWDPQLRGQSGSI